MPRAPVIASEDAVQREIARTERLRARYLFLDDADYPPLLAEIENAPPALILRGRLELVARPCVAMVGARNASAAASNCSSVHVATAGVAASAASLN